MDQFSKFPEFVKQTHDKGATITANHPWYSYGLYYSARKDGGVPGGYQDDYDNIEINACSSDQENADVLISAQALWNAYLQPLAVAVNNVRMLFDCTVVLGGYVGSYMEDFIDDLRTLVAARNPFESSADYVQVCRYKTEAIAAGGALYYIDNFLKSV